MSTADNTPDFDSMSPEELMAWMETLAERQGATEGFTTSTRMDIAEVDPDSVEVEDKYIPYGMTEEQWAQKKAEEEAQKAARRATQPVPAAVSAPPPQPAVSVEQPAAEAASAGGDMPDFDSMSPEEMMRWMESLAKRQGAEIGFTTQADMAIPEVDASKVEVQDTYWDEERLKREEKRRQQREQAAPPPVPVPQPVVEEPQLELPKFETTDLEAETEIAPPIGADSGLDWLESLAAESGGDFPQMDLSALGEEISGLESLDLGSEMASLDLGELDALVTPAAEETADATDPMAWLESLTQQRTTFDLPTEVTDQEDETAFASVSTGGIADPTAVEDVDPLEWLESLAKRQGADEDEFITNASLDVPLTDATSTAPGYTDYSFETADMRDAVSLPELETVDALDRIDGSDPDDPAAWLDSLATSKNLDTHPSFVEEEEEEYEAAADDVPATEQIMGRLHSGQDVSPDEMANWMANLLEKGAARTDAPPDYIEEEEEEEIAIEASIPDWLIEQVGPPPDLSALGIEEPSSEPASLELPEVLEGAASAEVADLPDWLQTGAVEEAAAEPGIPDWLREPEEEAASVMGDIFAAETVERPEPVTAAPPVSVIATGEIEIDISDPWVEAFELERREGLHDITKVPDWYQEKLRQMGVEGEAVSAASLQKAELPPETELAAGELEEVPAWLGQAMPMPVEEAVEELAPAELPDWLKTEEEPAVELPDWLRGTVEEPEIVETADMPSMPPWLQDTGIEKTDTVPDWLLETVEERDRPAPAPVPAAPTPAPQPVPAAVSPAPVSVSSIDVDATLHSAKQKVTGGDLEGGLADYEAVVRANAHLDTVVRDLTEMIRGDQKSNPVVYRVLGDSLMRQGHLQQALDTYRKALNLL